MATDAQPQLDFAHVLYVDLVGYSKLLMEQQLNLIRELQEIVQGTTTYQNARPGDDLIGLPTGDGMTLAFFGSPTAPAECAVEITQVAQQRPHVSLRMGIHSGPVYHVSDINSNLNISGGGINIAQRVMDCGDDGHILVSRTVADVLAQLTRWTSHLSDLGEVEVKHGFKVHLYNLHADGFGNPVTPSKLAAKPGQVAPAEGVAAPAVGSAPPAPMASALAAVAQADRATAPQPADAAATGVSGLRVALLYKREAPVDERMLAVIERRLLQEGASVFIDRHLDVGLEWATEIERQIRGADAVLPLVSEASIHSEMLSMELRIAHEAAQEQDGKPRILPLRIAYSGVLPQEMADILDPIQYAMWASPEDDDDVLDQLVRGLAGQPMGAPTAGAAALASLGPPSTTAAVPASATAEVEFHPAGG